MSLDGKTRFRPPLTASDVRLDKESGRLRFSVLDYYNSERKLRGVAGDACYTAGHLRSGETCAPVSDLRNRKYRPFPPWRESDFLTCLFGRTAKGHSVCVVVKTHPQITLRLPAGSSKRNARAVVTRIRDECKMQEWELFSRFEMRKDAAGFHGGVAFPFLDLKFRTMGRKKQVLKMLRKQTKWEVVEGNIAPVQRFLEETGIQPGSVVSVRHRHLQRKTREKVSHCDFEYWLGGATAFDAGRCFAVEEDCKEQFPLVICSFDIECVAPGGAFPRPELSPGVFNPPDKIVCICNTTIRLDGEGNVERKLQVVHGVGDFGSRVSDPSVVCYQYETEAEMLKGWRLHLVVVEDPDWLVGHNIDGFDFHYMYARAIGLGASQMHYFGRLICTPCWYKAEQSDSNAHGDFDRKTYEVPGRAVLDTLTYFKKHPKKLSSYSLKNICEVYLGGLNKLDLPAPEMNAKYASGEPAQIRDVIEYCIRDTELPLRLLDRLLVHQEVVGLSRVTRCFVSDLFGRGQAFRAQTLLYLFARKSGFALGNLPNYTAGFNGALVLDVVPGLHGRRHHPRLCRPVPEHHPRVQSLLQHAAPGRGLRRRPEGEGDRDRPGPAAVPAGRAGPAPADVRAAAQGPRAGQEEHARAHRPPPERVQRAADGPQDRGQLHLRLRGGDQGQVPVPAHRRERHGHRPVAHRADEGARRGLRQGAQGARHRRGHRLGDAQGEPRPHPAGEAAGVRLRPRPPDGGPHHRAVPGAHRPRVREGRHAGAVHDQEAVRHAQVRERRGRGEARVQGRGDRPAGLLQVPAGALRGGSCPSS